MDKLKFSDLLQISAGNPHDEKKINNADNNNNSMEKLILPLSLGIGGGLFLFGIIGCTIKSLRTKSNFDAAREEVKATPTMNVSNISCPQCHTPAYNTGHGSICTTSWCENQGLTIE